MKNTELNFKKAIVLAIPFSALFALCSSNLFAQPPSGTITINNNNPCFVISASWVTDGSKCVTNQCGPDPGDVSYCDACVDITITAECPTLYPIYFYIHSESTEDCHSVCSPSGDFSILSTGCNPDNDSKCSYCDPREIQYLGNSGNGLPYTHSATFRICHRTDSPYTQQTYNIYLPSGSCVGSPCNNANPATIAF